MGDLNPDGACGNAAAATAQMGEVLLANAARNFAAFLSEFARFCDANAAGDRPDGL
jgi:creatinine amidohydrolase